MHIEHVDVASYSHRINNTVLRLLYVWTINSYKNVIRNVPNSPFYIKFVVSTVRYKDILKLLMHHFTYTINNSHGNKIK